MARRNKGTTAKRPALALQIRSLRERLKLSQGGFARHLGVSQQTVSDWERGKRLRQIEVALRLSRFLEEAGAASFR